MRVATLDGVELVARGITVPCIVRVSGARVGLLFSVKVYCTTFAVCTEGYG